MPLDTTVESQDQPAQIATPQSNGAEPVSDPTCLEHTYLVLRDQGLATPDELRQLAEAGQGSKSGERQLDPLELLVGVRIADPDLRPPEIERMGRAMAQVLGLPQVLVPFANRLSTPSGFYTTYPALLGHCKGAMTPVLFAEETEVIGIGSINPIAMLIAEAAIGKTLSEITGTKPIVSRLLLPFDAWVSLCHTQFGL